MTLYAQRNARSLEPHLSRHMMAMTEEELHNKGDIACELAWRDAEIERLQAQIDTLMLEFCPDEMTPEQMERWGENQKPALDHKKAPR